ncbi:kinase-like domain-containing protein [Trichophaea hybrida]|nr:kinase-like domain-containing protein [Trichophaea hybrida]
MFSNPQHVNDHTHNDLISFLSIVQKWDVDFLPITWNPALGDISQSGSGTICQSTFNQDLSLAFKRYHGFGNEPGYFLPLISEVLILSQPPVVNHPNIIDLEGVCWEIKSPTNEAVPVLVFEKAAWDLSQFMNSEEALKMSTNDRLQICTDIGNALLTLHAYDVIHGDIKPQNVLVFKEAGKTTIKSEVTAPKAKEMDVYSFGLLCFWVLFGHKLSNVSTFGITESETEKLAFEVPFEHHGPTLLESLKKEGKMEAVANAVTESMSGLSSEHKIVLKKFYALTLAHNPDDRTDDITKLVNLLNPEGTTLQHATTRQSNATEKSLFNANLQLAILNHFLDSKNQLQPISIGSSVVTENPFLGTDFRIAKSLSHFIEFHYLHQPFASNLALQVAFCYRIGFGIAADDDHSQIWLERAGKQQGDLEIEMKSVRAPYLKNKRIRMFEDDGRLQKFLLSDEYRSGGSGSKKLKEAIKETQREVCDMAHVFGDVHFVPLQLKAILGDLMDEHGDLEDAKALRTHIKDETKNAYGTNHPEYLNSLLSLARSHKLLGEWEEAQVLQEASMKDFDQRENSIGSAGADLASIYRQPRLDICRPEAVGRGRDTAS